MRIAVLGLGRVGVVETACLLRAGHTIIGIDTDPSIIDCFSHGLSPFHEPDVAELLSAGHADGRLAVTLDPGRAADADLVFVCVGTPGFSDGSLDLSSLKRAARELGKAVRARSPERAPILLVFRSSMLPGSMEGCVMPEIAEAAGAPAGVGYEVVYHPEFIREGSAVADYLTPARIVIGERQEGSAAALLTLYQQIDAPIFTTSLAAAELVKFADNSFHALKICFANEVGRFAIRAGISPADIFDIFTADTKLNLSASYLRPGGAFGGPCLLKDVGALAAGMRGAGIDAPVIDGIIESNSLHTDFIIEEIERRAPAGSRTLLVGLSFKAGTDDVRDSPLVRLAEYLMDRGHDLAIYDPDILDDVSTGMPGRAFAELSARLSAVVLRTLPSGNWNLIVLGKNHLDTKRVFGPTANILNLHRLEFDARTDIRH
jgi:GDP-mannose 6-dehydrogenase